MPLADIWPVENGIIKKEGCVLYLDGRDRPGPRDFYYKSECIARCGFYPREGQAWHIEVEGDNVTAWRVDHLYDFDEPIFVKDLDLS